MAIPTLDRRANNVDTVNAIVQALRRMGHHGALELRTDGEPSLLELMRNVAEKRGGQTLLQRSPAYDSQSNGRVERAVRGVEELSRVLKIDFEARLNDTISVHDALFAWLIRHAVMCLNIRQVRNDGRTSFERQHGRPYRSEFQPFGARVLFKKSNKTEGGTNVSSMAIRAVAGKDSWIR